MIRKKPAPHLMRGGTGFPKEIMLRQEDRSDDDSKKSHPALSVLRRRVRVAGELIRSIITGEPSRTALVKTLRSPPRRHAAGMGADHAAAAMGPTLLALGCQFGRSGFGFLFGFGVARLRHGCAALGVLQLGDRAALRNAFAVDIFQRVFLA